MDTKAQVKAALQTVMALAETIRDLKQVPSGKLYAQVMEHMDLTTYTSFIERLKGAGLVKEKHNELFWVGPKS